MEHKTKRAAKTGLKNVNYYYYTAIEMTGMIGVHKLFTVPIRTITGNEWIQLVEIRKDR